MGLGWRADGDPEEAFGFEVCQKSADGLEAVDLEQPSPSCPGGLGLADLNARSCASTVTPYFIRRSLQLIAIRKLHILDQSFEVLVSTCSAAFNFYVFL